MVVRKMKEKCKDAARARREKERTEFVELSKLLPLPSSTTNQLDKASIIRLTSSYLRMRAAFPDGLGEHWGTHNRLSMGADGRVLASKLAPASTARRPNVAQLKQAADRNSGPAAAAVDAQAPEPNSEKPHKQQQIKELGSLILQTLDGFVFALHKDGKIMYISETASVHLGLPQIDLTGSSIYEYIHPTDCNELNELFSLTEADRQQLEARARLAPPGAQPQQMELGRSFCMRMKCILPKRNAGLVSNGYKAIHCNGYMKVQRVQLQQQQQQQKADCSGAGKQLQSAFDEQPTLDKGSGAAWEGYALVAVGHSLLPSASTEVKLGSSSFMFRASLDLKIYQIESVVLHLIGLDQTEMIGQSLYQFVHVDDSKHLAEAHKLLLSKGQAVTRYYRLMRRCGGFVWIESHASLINNPRSMPKPQHIVSVCYVIGQNQADQSMAHCQRAQISPTNADLANTDRQAKSLAHAQQLASCGKASPANRKRPHADTINQTIADKFRKCSANVNQFDHLVAEHRQDRVHNRDLVLYNTIGSTRRPSDDSCSIVSNMTSASVSSSNSTCSSYSASCLASIERAPLGPQQLFYADSSNNNNNNKSPVMIQGDIESCETNLLAIPFNGIGKHPVQLHSSFDAAQQPTVCATTTNSRPTVDCNGGQQNQQIWLVPVLNHDNQIVAATANAFTATSECSNVTTNPYDQHATSDNHRKHHHSLLAPAQQNYQMQQSIWLPSKEHQLDRHYNDNNNNNVYCDDNNIQFEQQYSSNSCYQQLNLEPDRIHSEGLSYEIPYVAYNPNAEPPSTTFIETEDCPITEIQCHQHSHRHHNHYQHAVCLNDR